MYFSIARILPIALGGGGVTDMTYLAIVCVFCVYIGEIGEHFWGVFGYNCVFYVLRREWAYGDKDFWSVYGRRGVLVKTYLAIAAFVNVGIEDSGGGVCPGT